MINIDGLRRKHKSMMATSVASLPEPSGWGMSGGGKGAAMGQVEVYDDEALAAVALTHRYATLVPEAQSPQCHQSTGPLFPLLPLADAFVCTCGAASTHSPCLYCIVLCVFTQLASVLLPFPALAEATRKKTPLCREAGAH